MPWSSMPISTQLITERNNLTPGYHFLLLQQRRVFLDNLPTYSELKALCTYPINSPTSLYLRHVLLQCFLQYAMTKHCPAQPKTTVSEIRFLSHVKKFVRFSQCVLEPLFYFPVGSPVFHYHSWDHGRVLKVEV